jgi:alpha-mannosidase
MKPPKYHVFGAMHIDLAWKKTAPEMSEMLEVFVIRLLDALEQHPEFTYIIEQAAHYRQLAARRPDLVERLKPFVQNDRLEFVGGMASTLETNIPNGECFVRNQTLGLRWVRETFAKEPTTGWLIDTFGSNAQIPQILHQFGIRRLMANRFGNVQHHDVFLSHGLDGSEILVAGRDVYSPFVRHEHIFWSYTEAWEGVDRLFASAAEADTPGPFLVTPYLENESYLRLRHLDLVRQNNRADPGAWMHSLPHRFFDALEETGKTWPVVWGDLNPEFTATFSQRIAIRTRNRTSENLLLEAEKWAALMGLDGWQAEVQEAWWTMAFNHFHDVFTGSHPTAVFRSVISNYDRIDACSNSVLERSLTPLTTAPGQPTLLAFNGLSWDRRALVQVVLPPEIAGIQAVNGPRGTLPFMLREGELSFVAEFPAASVQAFALLAGSPREPAPSSPFSPGTNALIENDFIRLSFDPQTGLRLVWKPTGAVLLENCPDFLVAQQDNGSFQIEAPLGAEVIAGAGEMRMVSCHPSPLGSHLEIAGSFPTLSWAGENASLHWQIEFTLLTEAACLDLNLIIDWVGEGTRVRFKLPTSLDTAQGIYEIPFGVVRRNPSGIRGTVRGEWPAHRFVAVEAAGQGLALINTGTPGVEVNGGTIWTSLLRAPKAEYAGMVPDETSSQHGRHLFRFRIAPYTGQWENSPIVRLAQEFNHPAWTRIFPGLLSPQIAGQSWLRLEPPALVLSSVKSPDDPSPSSPAELVIRFYETIGQPCTARLFVANAREAWGSDLRENKTAPILCQDEKIELAVKPFEIVTLRVSRTA